MVNQQDLESEVVSLRHEAALLRVVRQDAAAFLDAGLMDGDLYRRLRHSLDLYAALEKVLEIRNRKSEI